MTVGIAIFVFICLGVCIFYYGPKDISRHSAKAQEDALNISNKLKRALSDARDLTVYLDPMRPVWEPIANHIAAETRLKLAEINKGRHIPATKLPRSMKVGL